MTKLTIESVHLATDLAVKSWPMYWHDGSNVHTGKVYLSSAGTWYVWTPSQWGNGHWWELSEPGEILNQWDRYLTTERKAEIAEEAGISWE